MTLHLVLQVPFPIMDRHFRKRQFRIHTFKWGSDPRGTRCGSWVRDLGPLTLDLELLLRGFVQAQEVVVVIERIRVSASQGELSGFDVLESHAFPVQQIRESLSSIPLIDALTT